MTKSLMWFVLDGEKWKTATERPVALSILGSDSLVKHPPAGVTQPVSVSRALGLAKRLGRRRLTCTWRRPSAETSLIPARISVSWLDYRKQLKRTRG